MGVSESRLAGLQLGLALTHECAMAGRPLRKQREREAQEGAALAKPQPRRKRSHKERMERVLVNESLPARDKLFVIEGAHGDPLRTFREGLALARRAGLTWWRALGPTYQTALSVESDKREREQWAVALEATLSAWRDAYEHRSAR